MHSFTFSVYVSKKDISRILWLSRDKDSGVTTNYFNFFYHLLLFKTLIKDGIPQSHNPGTSANKVTKSSLL